jgi:Flp pilus assembly protein TadB
MQDKYQKEIEEILKNAGEVAPDESGREFEKSLEDRPKAVRQADEASKPQPYQTPRGRWPSITPGKVLLTGLVVFIITALLQIWVLIWVGLALLVLGYLLFFITPRNISIEKRWRGESIEDKPVSVWDSIKRWMKS